MTASLDDLLGALAGGPPGPLDLCAVRWRCRQRQRRLRAARGGVAGTAILALVIGLAVLARPEGYDVDTVDPAASTLDRAVTTAEQTRVLVNPVTDASTHLVQPDPRTRFRVTANEPSYWRTAGADDYDGTSWRSRYDDGAAPDGTGEAAVADTLLEQTIAFGSSDVVWLPIAPGLRRATSSDIPLQWDAESGTLMAGPLDAGVGSTWSYQATSAVANLTPEELRATADETPGERYTELVPGAVTPAVAIAAEQATVGATTRYDRALALQNRLRSLPYSVEDLNVEAATIEAAVVGGQGGASPQLATAFVVMARHLGIPSRIAVGYTWGEPSPAEGDRTTYLVSDRHSHVWPEVWFAGIGWVPFEPTPGRGIPRAEAYTGVPAQQDTGTADDGKTPGP